MTRNIISVVAALVFTYIVCEKGVESVFTFFGWDIPDVSPKHPTGEGLLPWCALKGLWTLIIFCAIIFNGCIKVFRLAEFEAMNLIVVKEQNDNKELDEVNVKAFVFWCAYQLIVTGFLCLVYLFNEIMLEDNQATRNAILPDDECFWFRGCAQHAPLTIVSPHAVVVGIPTAFIMGIFSDSGAFDLLRRRTIGTLQRKTPTILLGFIMLVVFLPFIVAFHFVFGELLTTGNATPAAAIIGLATGICSGYTTYCIVSVLCDNEQNLNFDHSILDLTLHLKHISPAKGRRTIFVNSTTFHFVQWFRRRFRVIRSQTNGDCSI